MNERLSREDIDLVLRNILRRLGRKMLVENEEGERGDTMTNDCECGHTECPSGFGLPCDCGGTDAENFRAVSGEEEGR
jgi:hypothetical protein